MNSFARFCALSINQLPKMLSLLAQFVLFYHSKTEGRREKATILVSFFLSSIFGNFYHIFLELEWNFRVLILHALVKEKLRCRKWRKNQKKLSQKGTKSSKLPRAIPFVLANILLERYSGKGTSGEVRARSAKKFDFNIFSGILLLFLNRKLNFDQNISSAIFHLNELLGFLIPIFGAIIADSWLGLYKTITWMSLVFALGCLTVSVCAIEALNLPMWASKI